MRIYEKDVKIVTGVKEDPPNTPADAEPVITRTNEIQVVCESLNEQISFVKKFKDILERDDVFVHVWNEPKKLDISEEDEEFGITRSTPHVYSMISTTEEGYKAVSMVLGFLEEDIY